MTFQVISMRLYHNIEEAYWRMNDGALQKGHKVGQKVKQHFDNTRISSKKKQKS